MSSLFYFIWDPGVVAGEHVGRAGAAAGGGEHVSGAGGEATLSVSL